MKVTTLQFFHRGSEDIKFTYDVNVAKDGTFSTTLPKEAVSKIEAYGVELNKNRQGNSGYFCSETMDGLERKIREVVNDAVSCELVCTEDVIEYQISICAQYCKNKADEGDTELYPSSHGLNGNCQFVEGNVSSDLVSKNPISFSVYAMPVTIKRYRYKSGREREEKVPIEGGKYDSKSAILFLNSIMNVYPDKYKKVKQMPCTEENAQFFKNAITSIWKLNEALGRVLKDDTLELAIKAQKLFLETPSA